MPVVATCYRLEFWVDLLEMACAQVELMVLKV